MNFPFPPRRPAFILTLIMDAAHWNRLIASLPNPHLLQTLEWGQVKAKYGWKPFYVLWLDDGRFLVSDTTDHRPLIADRCLAACLILKRAIPMRGFAARLSVLYAPKGPLFDWMNEPLRRRALDDLQSFARKQGAIFLKIDPDVVLGTGVPGGAEETVHNGGQAVMSDLMRRGWKFSSDQIQFRNTVLIDLTPSEEEMLARMKQKARYNVRLAMKRGVTVRLGMADDLPMLYKMYAETSVRDDFVIRDQGYYHTVWKTFMSASSDARRSPLAIPLIAEVNGEAVAGLFLFLFAGRAYYLYGMSREAHREKMPNHLLQWEAMRRAKAAGCTIYDLWGAPEEFNESDSMWGVYRFKEGLGGRVVRTLGAWDYAPNPLWYGLYTQAIPRLLDVMRVRGKASARQSTGA